MLEVVICGLDSGVRTDSRCLQDSTCHHTYPVRSRLAVLFNWLAYLIHVAYLCDNSGFH